MLSRDPFPASAGAGLWTLAGRAAETLFILFTLSTFMSAYFGIPVKMADAKMETGDQNLLYTAAQALVLLILALLHARHWRRTLEAARLGGLINLFVLLAFASLAWSHEPSVTARRVVTLANSVGFAYYAAIFIPMELMIRRVAQATLAAAVASAALALAVPSAGVMTGAELEGAWSGVFMHKNQLGWMMILGAMACGWLFAQEPRRRVRHALGFLFCFAMAVMSRSKTAQLAIVMIPVIATTLRVVRLPGLARLWAMYGVAVAGIAGAALMAAFFEPFMLSLGKDPSLTGRLPLWIALLRLVAEHPLLGYGYGAFFVSGNPDMEWVQYAIGWSAPEAHQAYIELMLQLGVPGMLIAVLILCGAARRALAGIAGGGPAWLTFAAVYVLNFAVTNMVETMLFHAGDIHCMLLPLIAVRLRMLELERRTEPVSPALARAPCPTSLPEPLEMAARFDAWTPETERLPG